LVLWTNKDIADEIWLLASPCKPSRWKRAFAFFFHPAALPVPVVISTDVPPKLTFFGPLAGLSLGMASFAKASAILLTFWAEVEGPVEREGIAGVSGTIAGEGFALRGF
jgi:hypothetical protein